MNRVTRIDPAVVRSQIELLRTTHPDVVMDNELFQLALESETDITEFMADIVARIADDNGEIAKADTIIDGWLERKRHFSQRIEAMRALAFNMMQIAELKKLELTQATLSMRLGPRKVVITDESALPESCIRIKREPNKTLIKELIDQGVPIYGAALSNAEPVLAITGLKRKT